MTWRLDTRLSILNTLGPITRSLLLPGDIFDYKVKAWFLTIRFFYPHSIPSSSSIKHHHLTSTKMKFTLLTQAALAISSITGVIASPTPDVATGKLSSLPRGEEKHEIQHRVSCFVSLPSLKDINMLTTH
jgi:hypothetical protein